MNRFLLSYLPYGAIDLLLTIAIISEVVNKRYDLLWANVPLLVWGLISLNKEVKKYRDDMVD